MDAPPPGSVDRRVTVVVVAAGLIAALYYGQVILVPLAVSILLAFLLTPLVKVLQRWRLPSIVAVLVVTLLSYAVLGAVAWTLGRQAVTLAHDLPQYRSNIRAKLDDLRGLERSGGFRELKETLDEATEAMPGAEATTGERPVPVTVVRDGSQRLLSLPATVTRWLQPLATAGLVAILVPFMLHERQALTGRVIRLLGRRRIVVTTKALDEAAERVTRYLLTQTALNAGYGVMVAAGLALIGVPYALLWGFLAAVLRFIPYLGPWIGALLPILMSVAVFPGWPKTLLVLGLFVALELFSNMVLETILYAGSVGLSQVALLMAIAFWTALWGPIGLALATPLTVCVVVFGRYVPELHFLAVLMGDAPVVAPDLAFYQRALADDRDEMLEILERHAARGAKQVYDEVVVPALVHVRADRAAGVLNAEETASVWRNVRWAVENLDLAETPPSTSVAEPAPMVLGCPARDEGDRLALVMLERTLRPLGVTIEIASPDFLASETVSLAAERDPAAVAIVALPPGGLSEARYLLKRLSTTEVASRIVVGRWSDERFAEARSVLLEAGASAVTPSLVAMRDELLQLRQLSHTSPSAA